MSEDLIAHLLRSAYSKQRQCLSWNTFCLAHDAEQEVLRTNVLTTKIGYLILGTLEDALGTWRHDRKVPFRRSSVFANSFEHRPQMGEVHPQAHQRASGRAGLIRYEAEHDMLDADISDVLRSCCFLSAAQHAPGLLSEVL